ncbi:MAG: GAF domain-containing protein [Anaerolineales bacterium]|nr:GAF domain-containing protein [Anaerolineales bacterium]MCB0026296.1 GAF domain-containing protein [Anaerolineales bacterium]
MLDSIHDRELFILGEVAKVLAARLELIELLQRALEKIADTLPPAEFGIIFLWNASERLFLPQAVAGPTFKYPQAVLEISLRENESIVGKVYAKKEVCLLNTVADIAKEVASMRTTNQRAMFEAYGGEFLPKSIIVVPLCTDGHQYGVLMFETLHGSTVFTETDVAFIQTLADLIALEIERARLDTETNNVQTTQEANRLRAEVMATFSHELRTPLAAIKGYTTALLLDEVVWPEAKRREFLQLIDDETNTLEGMISEILDSSLIDVGQLEISPQPVRLLRMVQEVANEMQRHASKHRFAIDFPLEFPIIDVDPGRIRQVFRNILDNAIKYSPDGGLIMVRGIVRSNDVVISTADQGVGISPEDLIPLFDKYFRVKAPTGYYVPGTGLGLPVSRAIIEAHGGRIWANSKVGEGTILYFSLPLKGAKE